jgi:F-type H+-transporting ATPase subunit delta
MAEQRISRRYAKALYNAAEEVSAIDKVYEDLKYVGKAVESTNELEIYLKSPLIKSLDKKKALDEIFSGKISDLSKDFLILLSHKGREALIPSIVEQYIKIYNDQNNILPVHIKTAIEVSEDIKQNILAEIKERTGMTLNGTFEVDPAIKGGVVITLEDLVIDASLRNKLSELYQRLSQGEAA